MQQVGKCNEDLKFNQKSSSRKLMNQTKTAEKIKANSA
jgi:hypothetical protein